MFLVLHSNCGVCNHPDTSLVESRINMAVVFSMNLTRNLSNNGVNKEEREFDQVIEAALQGRQIQKLDLTHLSTEQMLIRRFGLEKRMQLLFGAKTACIGVFLVFLTLGSTYCRNSFDIIFKVGMTRLMPKELDPIVW
uniref:Uncharacterized protein n=1 Tax=Opuntia streptacantha TaxID=393608 RepID=A0A7C9FBU2_OPUST